MRSTGQPASVAIVDVEAGPEESCPSSLSPALGQSRRPSGHGEEYNQLLPRSPSSAEVKNGPLNNFTRFLSRSQNQIQIVPAIQKPIPEMEPLTFNHNNNNNATDNNHKSQGKDSDSESPSSSSNSPASPEVGCHRVPTFNGVNLLPMLDDALSQSASAPPSPSAGSKQQHINNNNNPNGTLTSIDAKFRRWLSNTKFGRIRKRVIFKNGEVNLSQTNISKRRRRFLQDLFTTLIDIQWRWTLLTFALSFILSWLFFAMVWWTIGFLHGDLDPENRLKAESGEWQPCFSNFKGFTSAFLFSIETQHTIGYGSRYTTEECPIAIFTMCMQSILGVLIQATMVGIIFAKMSRPKKRTQTLVFSRSAVICQRDGVLCLMFRVGDMRKSHIISAKVRAQIIKTRVTKEGEVLPYYQYELKVGVDSDQNDIFFIWPMMVVHKIDKASPLYAISASEMIKQRFEIIVSLEGVIESTGQTTQARSSYLPSEILWGHRFENIISFRKEIGEYAVNHNLFNSTYEYDTALISAKELDELNKLQEEMKLQGSNKLMTPYFRVPAIAQFSRP